MDERKLRGELSRRMTKRLLSTLNYICEYQSKNGMTPTYRELQEAMGLVSVSAPHRYVHGLVEMGYLEVVPLASRGIRILKNPSDDVLPEHMQQYVVEVLRGKRRLPKNVRIEQQSNEIVLQWPGDGPRCTVRIEEGVNDAVSV